MKFLSLLLTLLLLVVSPLIAQDNPVDTVTSLKGIEIHTSVDKAEIYIGDLVTYKLTIIYDSTLELNPPPLGVNLGAFDVKDYKSDIFTDLKDGRFQSENIFVLSTFTTGEYMVPPIPVIFNLPDGSYKALLSEAVPIKVLSMLLNVDDSTDIKPLKAQYEFKQDWSAYYLWGGIVLFLLLLAAVLLYRKFGHKEEESEQVDNRPAWEIAFEKLAFLKQKQYLRNEQFKLYYIDLTEALRSYYERIYKQNYLDMTTEEFLDEFKEQDLPETIYEDTKKYLRHADLVKFAKFIPALERAEADYELVHEMIEKVRLQQEAKSAEVTISGSDHNTENSEKPEEVVP